MLSDKKYCETCKQIYVLQASSSCSHCGSVVQSTFLVDERFSEIRQYKANRQMKQYSEMMNKD